MHRNDSSLPVVGFPLSALQSPYVWAMGFIEFSGFGVWALGFYSGRDLLHSVHMLFIKCP